MIRRAAGNKEGVTQGRVVPAGTVDRASRNDLLQLTFQGRPSETQVGAVLVLAPGRPLALGTVRHALGERIRAVPRLRQRLVPTPLGSGRPVWVDDPRFEIAAHVREVTCPQPGDRRALLDLAESVVTTPVPTDRPPWSATLVHRLAGGRTGLVLSFHHVLADGVGGLAVLAQLADGGPAPAAGMFPRPLPTRRRLAADATRDRLRQLRELPRWLRLVAAGLGQSRAALVTRAPPTSLNRPTGPNRRLATARTDLVSIHAVARSCGGTVNDVVLAAIGGALRSFLLGLGERRDELVVGVPVSGRPAGQAAAVRNQVGMVPVLLPTGDAPMERLRAVVRRTRAVKSGARGATAVLLEPAFALLARLRVARWYVNRQRRMNVFATNLRGPSEPLTFLGAPVTDLIPVNAVVGNVAVAFGALSYAGNLTVTVVADPDICPAEDHLATELQRQLDTYAALARAQR